LPIYGGETGDEPHDGIHLPYVNDRRQRINPDHSDQARSNKSFSHIHDAAQHACFPSQYPKDVRCTRVATAVLTYVDAILLLPDPQLPGMGAARVPTTDVDA